ncbi:MAG: hypothetical protein ACYCWE_20645 [Eubacteriales bacterium]
MTTIPLYTEICNIMVKNNLKNSRENPGIITYLFRYKQTRQATIESFLDELKRLDGVTEFQHALWYSIVDFVTVSNKGVVRVTFKDGTEMKV